MSQGQKRKKKPVAATVVPTAEASQAEEFKIPEIKDTVEKVEHELKKCQPHQLCAVCYKHPCNGASEQRFVPCHCKCGHDTGSGKAEWKTDA